MKYKSKVSIKHRALAFLEIYNKKSALLPSKFQGSPEPIFSVKSNPVNEKLFVSYGKSHLAFWTIETLSTNKLGLIKKMGIYDVRKLSDSISALVNEFPLDHNK